MRSAMPQPLAAAETSRKGQVAAGDRCIALRNHAPDKIKPRRQAVRTTKRRHGTIHVKEPGGMTEPLPPLTVDESYKPISGFALGGLILSGGFAALVFLSAAVAVVKGAPIFYPTWLLLTPILGFVLCFMGRNRI